jgi:hypothetical protein
MGAPIPQDGPQLQAGLAASSLICLSLESDSPLSAVIPGDNLICLRVPSLLFCLGQAPSP